MFAWIKSLLPSSPLGSPQLVRGLSPREALSSPNIFPRPSHGEIMIETKGAEWIPLFDLSGMEFHEGLLACRAEIRPDAADATVRLELHSRRSADDVEEQRNSAACSLIDRETGWRHVEVSKLLQGRRLPETMHVVIRTEGPVRLRLRKVRLITTTLS